MALVKKYYWTNPTGDRLRAQEIRLYIEKELKGILELVSPFYDRAGQPTEEIKALDKGEKSNITSYEILGRDIDLITESDGVVGIVTNKTSWGSIQEFYESKCVQHKPTYIIFDERTQGTCSHCGTANPNNPDHPWAVRSAVRTFNSPDSFIDYMKHHFGSKQEVQEVKSWKWWR